MWRTGPCLPITLDADSVCDMTSSPLQVSNGSTHLAKLPQVPDGPGSLKKATAPSPGTNPVWETEITFPAAAVAASAATSTEAARREFAAAAAASAATSPFAAAVAASAATSCLRREFVFNVKHLAVRQCMCDMVGRGGTSQLRIAAAVHMKILIPALSNDYQAH